MYRWLPSLLVFAYLLSFNFPGFADRGVNSSQTSAVEIIRVRTPQSESDSVHQFYVTLIRKAIDYTRDEMGDARLEFRSINASQGRVIALLESNQLIDVSWFGTSRMREKRLLAVKAPLHNGLLGRRMMVIKHKDKARFDSIKTADELKALTACQGDQWPDSDILEYNGFKVERTAKFESMYRMLEQGHCDYFPRSVIEGYGEVVTRNNPDLIAYDRILLDYPFYNYFFVNKNNRRLHDRLKKGLETMLARGELLQLMKEHPMTSSAFPESKYDDSLVFKLVNNL